MGDMMTVRNTWTEKRRRGEEWTGLEQHRKECAETYRECLRMMERAGLWARITGGK